LALVNRRKMASVEAVPVRIAVAYLIMESYWAATRSQRIGRVSAGSSRGQAPGSPAAGRYSRVLLTRLIRGSRSKPSSRVMPNPISDWPWVSV
jgi:hypothetical protein